MNRMRISTSALLAIAALLAGGSVCAEPRDPSFVKPPPRPPDTPEMREARRLQQAAEMDIWLRRLIGRFRVEGVIYRYDDLPVEDGTAAAGIVSRAREQPEDDDPPKVKSARGMEDCIGLGSGAGVQCVINVLWEEEWTADGQAVEEGVSTLAPAMIEYGLDPVASRIRYLQVDNKSLAEGAAGVLKGDTLTTRVRCANTEAVKHCERVMRIYAPPGGKYLQLNIDREYNHNRITSLMLDLRRMSPGEAGAAADVRVPQLPEEKDPAKAQDPRKARQPARRASPPEPPMRGGARRR